MGFNEIVTSSPEHIVFVSGFLMSKYEITYSLWQTVRNWALTNNYNINNEGTQGLNKTKGTNPNHPVTSITWFDAIAWCNALSEMLGKEPVYYKDIEHKEVYKDSKEVLNYKNDFVKWEANGFRLPTEAEYEYAARNKGHRKGTSQYSGSNNINEVAWYLDNSFGTNEVGKKKPNELGLYDLSGNVWEWCWDRYGEYSKELQSDPHGPDDKSLRVLKGGSASADAFYCEISERGNYNPSDKNAYIGFRIITLLSK